MMNAGESLPNAYFMREQHADEKSVQTVRFFLSLFFFFKSRNTVWNARIDRPAEAGVVQEGVGAVGSADEAGDSQQPELRLQTAYRGAQRISHCQRATCCHPANGGKKRCQTAVNLEANEAHPTPISSTICTQMQAFIT